MADWISLYVVFWVLRCFEYLHVCRSNSVMFQGRGRRRCRAMPLSHESGTARFRAVLGNPLDLLGGVFFADTEDAGRTDANEVRRILATYESSSGVLRRAEVALAAHLFVVVPCVWATLGIVHTWIYLLGGALALQALTIVGFRLAYRAVSEAADPNWLWKALPLLLAPPAATAGHLALTKPLFTGHHAVSVAAELCTDDEFRGLALTHLRRLEFPVATTAVPLGDGDRYDKQIREIRRVIAERLGAGSDALVDPPRRSLTAKSYCPRCLAEYTASEESCSDCTGVPLKRFAS